MSGTTYLYNGSEADRHSTLEPVNHSTLEAVPYRADEDGFGAKQIVITKTEGSYNDVEGGSVTGKGGFWKRRVCGLSIVTVAIILTIIVLGAVGGGVGGALAVQNKTSSVPSASALSTTTSTNTDGQSITATGTAATETASTATTSTKATPLPPYPTKAVAANAWHKIGTPCVQSASLENPWQLEARWADVNDLGSIGLTPNSTEQDQIWQLLAVPQSNEKSKFVYDNAAEAGGAPTSLYYIACRRFGQGIRMVVDNIDVERYKDSGGSGTIGVTMARQNDEELGQYWWLNQTASNGDMKTFKVHNLKSGNVWRLRASINGEGNGIASLVSGEEEEVDLWDVSRVGRIGSQDGWFIYD